MSHDSNCAPSIDDAAPTLPVSAKQSRAKSTLCSRCRQPNDRLPQRYCKACKLAHQRETRKKHVDFTPEQKRKALCRSKTRKLVASGKLAKLPCACGSTTHVEAHHADYSRPDLVRWLCRDCHLADHEHDDVMVSRRRNRRQLPSVRWVGDVPMITVERKAA